MNSNRKRDKLNRNSSIELLKMIAMFMIVISHTIPRYGNYSSCIDFAIARPGLVDWLLYVFYYFGQIGNAVFIICSAWFLCDSQHIKLRKISHIYADAFTISILWLVITWLLGFIVPLKDVIKSFLPVFFKNNWFISCYIVFYILHPILNGIINRLSQREHLSIVIIMSAVYSCLATVWLQAYYYNELVGFILLYFIVTYMKQYMHGFRNNMKWNILILLSSVIMLFLLIGATQFMGCHTGVFSNQMLRWCCFNNPLVIMIALSSFNLFNKMEFRSVRVNEIMSVSLIIYIVHENLILNETLKPYLWQLIYEKYGYSKIVFWVLGFAIIYFVGSAIVALLYKITIQKFIKKRMDSITDKISTKYNQFVDSIVELEKEGRSV